MARWVIVFVFFNFSYFFKPELAGALDFPGPAGFIFGAQNGSSFLALEFPAGGLLLVPEASSGCTCNFAIQTSLAFRPRGGK